MANDKSLVTNLSVNTADAVGPLRQLETQAKGSDDALAAMAAAAADGLEDMSERAGKAFGRLADGGKVSQTALDGVLHEVDALRQQVIDTFGSIENAPEPFQKAVQAAESTARSLTAGMDAAAGRAAALRDEFQATTPAIDATATAMDAVAVAERRAAEEAAALAVSVDATDAALKSVGDDAQRAAELVEGVGEKFGDIPKQIEEIRDSSKIFREQQADLELIVARLKDEEKALQKVGDVGQPALKKVRDEIDRTESAIKDLAKESESGSGKIRDGFVRVEDAFKDFDDAIEQGSPRMGSHLDRVVLTIENLRGRIEAIQSSGGTVPPGELERLQQYEARLNAAQVQVGSLTNALANQKREATEAGETWTGIGDAFNKALGPMGAVQAKGILIGAALKEGWQIGTQFAKALGTDFQALDSTLDSFTAKAKTVNASVLSWLSGDGSFESVRASLKLTKAEFEGYNSTVLAGIKDLGDYKTRTEELNQIQQAHVKILAEGTEGQKLATQAKVDGAGILDQYVLALNLASEAAEIHRQLLLKGIEGEKLWNEIKKEGKGNLVDLAAAIRDNEAAIASLIAKRQEEISAEKELQAALNNTIAIRIRLLEMEKQQAELVTQQQAVEDGLTDALRNKLAEISASMVVKEGKEIPLTKLQIQQFEALLASTLGLTDAERKSLETLVEKLKAVEKLSQVQREDLAREIQRQLLINTSIEVDEKHRAVWDAKTKTMSNAAAETSKLTDEQMKLTKSSGETLAAGEKLKGGFGALAQEAQAVETGVIGFGKGLDAVVEKLDLNIVKVRELKSELAELRIEADKTGSSLQRASEAGQDEAQLTGGFGR